MRDFITYINEEKTLVDKLEQIDRIDRLWNDIRKKVQENPEYEKKWFTPDGKFNYSLFGKQAMLSVALLHKVCKEHNIAPYSVTYDYHAVFHDMTKDKPFCVRDGKKVWLKPTSKVKYLGRPYEREEPLSNYVPDTDIDAAIERDEKLGRHDYFKKKEDK